MTERWRSQGTEYLDYMTPSADDVFRSISSRNYHKWESSVYGPGRAPPHTRRRHRSGSKGEKSGRRNGSSNYHWLSSSLIDCGTSYAGFEHACVPLAIADALHHCYGINEQPPLLAAGAHAVIDNWLWLTVHEAAGRHCGFGTQDDGFDLTASLNHLLQVVGISLHVYTTSK